LRKLLEGNGHEVHDASDGGKGLDKFNSDDFDLVITDIVMPGLEGLSFIRELRRVDPETKIIAISGGGRIGPDTYLPLAEDLGAFLSFAKPFKNKELLDGVAEALAE